MLPANHLLELDLADGVSRAGAVARECSRASGGCQALGASAPLLAASPTAAGLSLRPALHVAQPSYAVHIHWIQLALHLHLTCLLSGVMERRSKGKVSVYRGSLVGPGTETLQRFCAKRSLC